MNDDGKGKRMDSILKSIGRGEILFTLKCDQFFPHIVYTFFLIFMVLLLNLMIEKTMVQVEDQALPSVAGKTERSAGTAGKSRIRPRNT